MISYLDSPEEPAHRLLAELLLLMLELLEDWCVLALPFSLDNDGGWLLTDYIGYTSQRLDGRCGRRWYWSYRHYRNECY